MGRHSCSIRRKWNRLGNGSRAVTTCSWTRTSRNSRASRRRRTKRKADEDVPLPYCSAGGDRFADDRARCYERPGDRREAERAFARASERDGTAVRFRQAVAEKGAVLEARLGRGAVRWPSPRDGGL